MNMQIWFYINKDRRSCYLKFIKKEISQLTILYSFLDIKK